MVMRHVSKPYSRTDFTLVLKIRIVFRTNRGVDLQIVLRVLKAYLALLIRHLMSSFCPSIFVNYTTLIVKIFNLYDVFLIWPQWICLFFFLLKRMASVFPMLIWSPVSPASSATRRSFSCASCCLWEKKLMSLAKSRSCSCFMKVH